MRTIHKYPFPLCARPAVFLPAGAEVLCVQTQRNFPMLWALVDDEAPGVRKHHFAMIGTGAPVPAECTMEAYVGTFQLDDGSFVFHVFSLGAM